jgi:WS/DGAT/MGAT family acyltransferase
MTDPDLGRHMTDVEALMWNLEKDPHLSAAFGNVTLFDTSPDLDRLRERLLQASVAFPRLRQRVAPVLGRLAPPEWVDDADFDIDYHLRRVALPVPGTERQLFDLAAKLAATPFDRSRPLWEYTVVDGLEGGRAALVQRMHHTLTDGEGGVRLSVQFIDLERDPGPVEAPADGGGERGGGPPRGRPLPMMAVEALAHNLRRQAGAARRVASGMAGTVTDPRRLLRLPGDAVDVVQSLSRQALVSGERRSPLWRERSLSRHFDVLRVPLDDAKRAAKALGGSVNDLFVAGAAGGAGAYHRAKGEPVDELRISMPVSTRSGRSAGGNSFTPTRVLVPTGPDPRERFIEINARLSVTKEERALGFTELLAGLFNVLPTSLLVRVAKSQVETVDFTTSNVRGAPWPLYIAGALIEGNFPLGPVAGTAFNLTTLSYNGSLDMGLHVDRAAVEEPDLLRACIEESFGELLAFS